MRTRSWLRAGMIVLGVSDVGAFYLSQAVVLGLAAIAMEPWLVRAALAGYVTFAVLHLVFHVTHLAGKLPDNAIGLTIALVLDAALPAALLIIAWSPRRARRSGRCRVRAMGLPHVRGGRRGQTVE